MKRQYYNGNCFKYFFKNPKFKTIVFIHGLGLNQDVWSWQVSLFKNHNILIYDHFIPDAILLNNDLSSGVPDIFNNIIQPILPDKNLGWTNRSKTIHFEYFSNVVNNFSNLLDIDAWLLEPLFRNCGEIDFKTKQGEDCLVRHATRLFALIEEKYK